LIVIMPTEIPDRPRSPFSRRSLLGLAIGGTAAGLVSRPGSVWARDRQPGIMPQASTSISAPAIIAGGGRGSLAAQWAEAMSGPLGQALNAQQAPDVTTSSGRDGVTAANLFDATISPDGNTALVVPGTAMLASLAGDMRVHFDYSRWIPLLVGQSRTLVIGRVDLHRTLRNLLRDRPVRVAVSSATGIELPTLLAMTLLGVRPIPVSGFATPQSAIEALSTNAVDVIQVPSAAVSDAQLAQITRAGGAVLFSLENSANTAAADTTTPDFPNFYAQLHKRPANKPLVDGLRAISIAASTNAALVLPMLTAPGMIAEWRYATNAASTVLTADATRSAITLFTGSDCTRAYADTNPDLTAQLALKRWIALRQADWRVG